MEYICDTENSNAFVSRFSGSGDAVMSYHQQCLPSLFSSPYINLQNQPSHLTLHQFPSWSVCSDIGPQNLSQPSEYASPNYMADGWQPRSVNNEYCYYSPDQNAWNSHQANPYGNSKYI